MTEPRTVGRMPMWRLRPALPMEMLAVVDVADLADGWPMQSRRTLRYSPEGRRTGSHAVFLSHELCGNAGAANELSALAGVKLDVVDNGTDRDVCQRKCVARLNVGTRHWRRPVSPAFRPTGARM